MPLTTLPFEGKQLIDRDFISDNHKSTGVIASLASKTPIGITGKETHYIDFDGDLQVFSEDNPLGAENEKRKVGSDANNFDRAVFPVTMVMSHRFPKKFLELFSGNGYTVTGVADQFRLGDPTTKLEQILQQPYQAALIDQYKAYVNRTIARDLDYVFTEGINPKFRTVSKIVRQNPFLLDQNNTAEPWRNVGLQPWTRPATPENGKSPAGDAFANAARSLAAAGEYSISGIISPTYENDIADEKTTIGLPTQFGNSLPLVANNVNISGVPLAVTNNLNDDLVAAAGTLPAGTSVDAIIGNFDRLQWDAIPTSDIEVWDTGDPDGTGVDLGQVNKVCLRFEMIIAWTIIGGASMFRAITHANSGSTTRSSK